MASSVQCYSEHLGFIAWWISNQTSSRRIENVFFYVIVNFHAIETSVVDVEFYAFPHLSTFPISVMTINTQKIHSTLTFSRIYHLSESSYRPLSLSLYLSLSLTDSLFLSHSLTNTHTPFTHILVSLRGIDVTQRHSVDSCDTNILHSAATSHKKFLLLRCSLTIFEGLFSVKAPWMNPMT